MISITRKEKKCRIEMEKGPLDYVFYFDIECTSETHAELLRAHFRKRFEDQVMAIREEEYNRGYKDGRAKRGKSTWFSYCFKKVH